LTTYTCAGWHETTVRPDDMLLWMNAASRRHHDSTYQRDQGFLIGEAVSSALHMVFGCNHRPMSFLDFVSDSLLSLSD
jgi:hypothetical protein